MNILSLVLFAILLGNDRFQSIKEFLAKIDFSSFAPVLKLLGFNDELLEFLCSEKFSELLCSSGDIKSILPMLSGLFAKKPSEKEDLDKPLNPPCQNDYLAPIKNVAPTDIEETLSEFLN